MESPRRMTCSCVIPKMGGTRPLRRLLPWWQAISKKCNPHVACVPTLVKSSSFFCDAGLCAAAAIMLPSPSTATGMFFDISTSPADISLYCDVVKLGNLVNVGHYRIQIARPRIGPPNIPDSKIAPDAIMPTPFNNCTAPAPAVKALVISSELVLVLECAFLDSQCRAMLGLLGDITIPSPMAPAAIPPIKHHLPLFALSICSFSASNCLVSLLTYRFACPSACPKPLPGKKRPRHNKERRPLPL